MLVFLFPTINFALIDSDCVPVTLFEIRELWLASTDPTLPATPSKVAKSKLPSPIASSHKRARSVDTGRDMQQPGPPSKLSRSHSADHIAVRAADPLRAPPLTYGVDLADEVDYGGSPDLIEIRGGQFLVVQFSMEDALFTLPRGLKRSCHSRAPSLKHMLPLQLSWMPSSLELFFVGYSKYAFSCTCTWIHQLHVEFCHAKVLDV